MTSRFSRKLKVILPLLLLYLACYFKALFCKLPFNDPPTEIGTSLQELPIKGPQTNFMFISTKDGNLHKYSKTNLKEKLWTISLGQALITSNITTTKNVTNDVLLLPLDDKLYYYENEKFTSLNIFIKDIVERTPLSFHDFLLVGNKKSTVLNIDIETGEIVHQSDKDYKLVNPQVKEEESNRILNRKNQSLLTVIRVDYMLTCIGKEEKFWDTTYSDIIIKIGNEQAPYAFLPKTDLMKALDYQSDIDINEIMSVHTSAESKDLPVKVYDKSSWRNTSNRNTNRNINHQGFHFVKEDVEFEDYLKWKSEKYSQSIYDLLWLLLVLIANQIRTLIGIYFSRVSLEFTLFSIGIGFILERIIRGYYDKKHPPSETSNRESLITVKLEYNDSSFRDSANELTARKENESMSSTVKANEENRLTLYNPLSQSLVLENGNGYTGLFNEIKIKQYEKERKNEVQVSSYSNSNNNTVVFEVNHTTKVVYQKNEETEKMHQSLQEEINQTIKSKSISRRNSSPMKQVIIIEEVNSKDSNNPAKKKGRKYTDGKYPKIELEIDEEDQIEEIPPVKEEPTQQGQRPIRDRKKKRESTKPSSNTMNQYSQGGSRLEKDFKDYEKIGQGGFGVVLKAKHKIDEEIYAIKIINLKDLDEQNVISEAKTMTKIHSKHIVEYKTCWFEHTLGTASQFVTSTEEISEGYSMSSSVIITNQKQKEMLLSKINATKKSISRHYNEDIVDKDSSNSIIFGDCSNGNEKTNELNKIFEDPYSDEEKHETKKVIIDFRDDSNIVSKRSSLSKKHIFIDNLFFFIQMEYCNGLPLDQFINQHQDASIPRETIFAFMFQIIKSLDKIHNRGIIHRDIKPANIFVEGDKGIKIGDFGLATEKKRNITSSFLDESANQSEMVGTPLYLSPEQLAGKNYNEKVDIFASGLVLYEMCACFGTLMERRECIQSLKSKRVLNDRLNEEYPIESKIILWMTETKQQYRPSAMELLQSSLFKQWKELIN